MIRYQINGKTVLLTNEQFLNLKDQDIQDLIAKDAGHFINDPFYDLQVNSGVNNKNYDESEDYWTVQENLASKIYYVPDLSEIDNLPEDEIDNIKKNFESDI